MAESVRNSSRHERTKRSTKQHSLHDVVDYPVRNLPSLQPQLSFLDDVEMQLQINETEASTGALTSDIELQCTLKIAEQTRQNILQKRAEALEAKDDPVSSESTAYSLRSPEPLLYEKLLGICLPLDVDQVAPEALQRVIAQMRKNIGPTSPATFESASLHDLAGQTCQRHDSDSCRGLTLIPLPSIALTFFHSMATLTITIPLMSDELNWQNLLRCLAFDLDLDKDDLIVIDAIKGSIKMTIAPKSNISFSKARLAKLDRKVQTFVVLPPERTTEYVSEQLTLVNKAKLINTQPIRVALDNYERTVMSENLTTDIRLSLTLDEYDLYLRLSERPVVIEEPSWTYIVEQSKKLNACVLHAFRQSTVEYVLFHVDQIHNDDIQQSYRQQASEIGNEKILFHGTSRKNIDAIFKSNFENFPLGDIKRKDSGWFGRGIYFTSSLKYATHYIRDGQRSILPIVCCAVALGRMLRVHDMSYNGRDLNENYHSHYVRVNPIGVQPVQSDAEPYYEEFVVKDKAKILPLFLLSLLPVKNFVVWRDAELSNEFNSDILQELRRLGTFNVYDCITSVEALSLLERKLNDDEMRAVMITNGGNNGKKFVSKCRQLCPTLPIIVFCKKVEYHQQWAAELKGPAIAVTRSYRELVCFIQKSFSSTIGSGD